MFPRYGALAFAFLVVLVPMANGAVIPTMPEQFTTNLTEYSLPTNETTVVEHIVYDMVNQRSRVMFAGIGLARTVQIARFDLHRLYQFEEPQIGKYTNCVYLNMTGTLNRFFDFPPTATANGTRTFPVNVDAQCWTYTADESLYQFCSQVKAAVPVWVAELSGPKRWGTQYKDFVAGQPPLSAFALPAGLHCVPNSDLRLRAPHWPGKLSA